MFLGSLFYPIFLFVSVPTLIYSRASIFTCSPRFHIFAWPGPYFIQVSTQMVLRGPFPQLPLESGRPLHHSLSPLLYHRSYHMLSCIFPDTHALEGKCCEGCEGKGYVLRYSQWHNQYCLAHGRPNISY